MPLVYIVKATQDLKSKL